MLINSFCHAQSYSGYHTSPYAGVYSILNNPADILNHRVRADINLVGVSAGVGNNIFTFKYNKINSDDEDDEALTFPSPIKRNGKLNLNTDVFGPSVLVRLSDKHAIALTTRARVMANLRGADENLLNTLFQDSIGRELIGSTLNIHDMNINAHAWKEIALSYSRQIGISDYGVWKFGASVKYLGGVAAFSMHSINLSFAHDSIFDISTGSMKDAVLSPKGSIAIGYTKNLDSLSDGFSDYMSFKNWGIGADIGISYEYRDEMQVYGTAYSEKTANYIWKAGVSITDIGSIRYRKPQTKGITTKLNGNNYTVDQLEPPSDSSDFYQMSNYYKKLFNSNTESPDITMQLPTTLHLSYDRYFNKWLGVQGQLNIPLMFSPVAYQTGNYNPASLVITPRAEIPQAGLYVPLTYAAGSGFQMGAALRLGPLTVGSASLINTRILSRTKAADVYFILRVPLFGYREYKDSEPKFQWPKLSRKERHKLNCPK
ncbi:MAG: hypothetical protein JNM14_06115 [Ferruginibacter sp.]|nr:hypothetical protein [Ferruginibacter sp.]